jgi:phage FluMu protein Com
MRNNQRRLAQVRGQKSSPPIDAPNLAFTVPTEFVEIPSKGKFYPEEHPLHDQETVEIKFMTAKDEDILSSKALLKKGLAIDRLLESLLVEDVDPSTLFIGDRAAILLAARISGYGSEYNFASKCPKCYTVNEIEFDLEQATKGGECFNERFLHENKIFYNGDTSTLDVELPASGVTVGLSLIDGAQERALLSEDKTSDSSAVTSILSAFITKVNDETDYNYVINFIESMPARDSKYLRDLYPKLIPNTQLLHHFMCTECLYQKEMEVPLSAEFFWP